MVGTTTSYTLTGLLVRVRFYPFMVRYIRSLDLPVVYIELFAVALRHGGSGYHMVALAPSPPGQLPVFEKSFPQTRSCTFSPSPISGARSFGCKPASSSLGYGLSLAISSSVLALLSHLSTITTAIFQCKPMAFPWDKKFSSGRCFST